MVCLAVHHQRGWRLVLTLLGATGVGVTTHLTETDTTAKVSNPGVLSVSL